MAVVLLALLAALAAPPAHGQPAPDAQLEVAQALAAEWTEEGSISGGLVNAIGLQIMVLASARKAFRR